MSATTPKPRGWAGCRATGAVAWSSACFLPGKPKPQPLRGQLRELPPADPSEMLVDALLSRWRSRPLLKGGYPSIGHPNDRHYW